MGAGAKSKLEKDAVRKQEMYVKAGEKDWAGEFSLKKSSYWVEVVVRDQNEGGVGGKGKCNQGTQQWEMKGRGKGEADLDFEKSLILFS